MIFEEVCPGDGRPRAAVKAARAFADGAVRSTWQRVAALEAHRAARAAADGAACCAGRAAGDAAAAAYLHPLARASQVDHVLRASAHAARAAELRAADGPTVAEAVIRRARQRTTPELGGSHPAAARPVPHQPSSQRQQPPGPQHRSSGTSRRDSSAIIHDHQTPT
ncbi:putative immunity protein [Actinopolyspora xinjiangensis]|uniref:putative immunity protein n=1 Tax=Actinopolyspora xinjiangensis TaxID=405564 RepID=UPI003CC7A534